MLLGMGFLFLKGLALARSSIIQINSRRSIQFGKKSNGYEQRYYRTNKVVRLDKK